MDAGGPFAVAWIGWIGGYRKPTTAACANERSRPDNGGQG